MIFDGEPLTAMVECLYRKRFCKLDFWIHDLKNQISSWLECSNYLWKFWLTSNGSKATEFI